MIQTNQKEKIENNIDERNCIICCNKNIPVIIPKEDLDNKYKGLFEDIKEKFRGNKNEIELDNFKKDYKKDYKEEIEEKIKNLNNKDEFNKCSLTDETLKKLRFLEYGIRAKIPMILQGYTSAGKSFLSRLACKINKKEYVIAVLSEHTTVENLLGRDLIDENNIISFNKGIVLDAYTKGKIVILDESDLATIN